MKHFLPVLLFFLIPMAVFSQGTPPVPHENVITFMDSLEANDSMQVMNLSSFNGLTDLFEDTARVFHDSATFSLADKQFMRKQLAYYRTRQWTDSDHLWRLTIIPQATIDAYAINGESGWKRFRRKYGEGYKVISFPIFTTDMNTAVIGRSYHIKRFTRGSVRLYKKDAKGRWMFIKTYSTWKG